MVKRKATNGNAPHTEQQKNKKSKEGVTHRSHKEKVGIPLALGEGDTGQLGLGPDILDRTKPALVGGIPNDAIQVCSGGMHSVCLTSNGEVWTWGCNDEGALGRTTQDEDESSVPGKVDLKKHVVQVSAGDSHTAALADDGSVFIWGTFRDANGSIGLCPGTKMTHSPVKVNLELVVVKISSGNDHLVCLTHDGEIYTLGNSEQGQLGRVAECFAVRGGRRGLDWLLSPGKVFFVKRKAKFVDVWTGQYVTFAQDEDGNVYGWGLNNYFQLGLKDMKNRYVPEKIKSFKKDKGWIEISGGQHHTLALDKDGQVYSLGRKEYGRLGLGENPEEKAEPTLVPALKDKKCVTVNCGTAVSFAVADNGEVFAWGMGTSKQLAQKEEDDLYIPTRMTGKQLDDRLGLMVSAGGQHTLLLAKDKS